MTKPTGHPKKQDNKSKWCYENAKKRYEERLAKDREERTISEEVEKRKQQK